MSSHLLILAVVVALGVALYNAELLKPRPRRDPTRSKRPLTTPMLVVRFVAAAVVVYLAFALANHPDLGVAVAVVVLAVCVPSAIWYRRRQQRKEKRDNVVADLEPYLGRVFIGRRADLETPKFGFAWTPGTAKAHVGQTWEAVEAVLTNFFERAVEVRPDHAKRVAHVHLKAEEPELPDFVAHPAGLLPGKPVIPLGVNAKGEVVSWDPRVSPHCIVVGETGGGKSVALRGAICESVARGYEVRAIDPKRISIGPMANWPGVSEVAKTLPSMTALVARVEAEREHRLDQLDKGEITREQLTPVVFVLDELSTLLAMSAEDHKAQGRRGVDPVLANFKSLCRLARECRIHLLVGLQQPHYEIIPTEARDQFSARLVMGEASPELARMARTGAKRHDDELPAGRGLFAAKRRQIEVQVYWTPEPGDRLSDADRAILDALHPGWSRRSDNGIEPQAKVVHRVSWKPSRPDVERDSFPGLRVVSGNRGEEESPGGKGGNQFPTEPPAGNQIGNPWFCPTHSRMCSTGYQKKGCREPMCLAWKAASREKAQA